MPYHSQSDSYLCYMGYKIEANSEKKSKSKSGFLITTTVYGCSQCAGCAHKAKCIKGASKIPLEDRSKNLYVSKNFQRQRQEMEARISTEEGIKLRTNRSIQVEGRFGVLKADMGFRQFLLRGSIKVEIELYMLSMAYNINKRHNKIQRKRCGVYLHEEKAAQNIHKLI